MFSRPRKARVLFGISDILLVSLAFALAYQTRSILHLEHVFFLTPEQMALVLGSALLAWVSIAWWLEIYEKLDSGHPRVILRDAARQCVYGALCVVVMEYALRLELSRFFVLLFSGLAWILLLIFRLTAGRVSGALRRGFTRPHYLLVVGTGDRARQLAGALEESVEYGVRLRGFLSEGPEAAPAEIRLGAKYPVYPIRELPALLREQVIDEIVFAVGSESLAGLEEVFLLCDEEGVRTRVAVDFFPHVNSTISLDRFGSTPLLTFSAAPYDEIRLLVKRVTDMTIAAAGLIVLSPLMAAIAVLIRVTSPGPAIFRQVRCGLNGRQFVFYKFRSMVQNAEELKAKLAALNEQVGPVFKMRHDPRITGIGRFIRKYSIDELPQLINVLRGDMSIVGPRPPLPSEVAKYEAWQRRRLSVRPGLTCVWQVSGRNSIGFEEWMLLDMRYIDHWSLAQDFQLILKTLPVVLTGRGAS